jgi:hypothetical protein
VQWSVSSFDKIKYVLNFQPPAFFVFLVLHETDITKCCLSFEDVSAYKILWSHVDWRKFCTHLSSLKIPPSPYSKSPLKKIFIQLKLAGTSTIFHGTKFRLPKCNGSWVVSIKTSNSPPYSYFWFLAKVVLLRVVQYLKNCQHTKFHSNMFTDASFASTWLVWKTHHCHI